MFCLIRFDIALVSFKGVKEKVITQGSFVQNNYILNKN